MLHQLTIEQKLSKQDHIKSTTTLFIQALNTKLRLDMLVKDTHKLTDTHNLMFQQINMLVMLEFTLLNVLDMIPELLSIKTLITIETQTATSTIIKW